MKSKKTYLLMLCTLSLILCSCSGAYISSGVTQSVIGPDTDTAYNVEVGRYGQIHKFNKNNKIDMGVNAEVLGFNSEKPKQADIGVSMGINARYVHNFNNDISFYLGGGGSLANNYGAHPDLASSPIYGKLFSGFKFKGFFTEIKHISSPFHDGSNMDGDVPDPDIGLNFINFGFEW